MGQLVEKLSLYADDAQLYLNDAGPSLLAALRIFDTFCSFSVIRINWSKSSFFPIDDWAVSWGSLSPLQWVDEFRKLGVQVTRHPTRYFDLNLLPLLSLLKTKCSSWFGLMLNQIGRINLIKMMILPKFNYICGHCLDWIPNFFFKEIDSCVGSFI